MRARQLMHTRKVCSLALRPGHVAKRCRVFPAEERKNLLLESKVWVPGSTVTPPSSESSESCRTGRWSIRAAGDFRGATKHHVTKLATAAEVAATAKSSHKSTSMAGGRAMFLGKDSQLEPQPVQHLTGSWCLRQQGFRCPRADRSAFNHGSAEPTEGQPPAIRHLPPAFNRKR